MGAQFELPLKNGAMLGAAVQMKIKKEAKIVKNLVQLDLNKLTI